MPYRGYMSETETRAILEPIARQVAEHLGDGWTVRDWRGRADENYITTMLAGPEGEEILLNLGDVGRLRISGFCSDPDISDHLKNVSITVAENRPLKALAGEITRRILPDLREGLTKAKAAVRKLNDDHAARTALADKVQGILPGARMPYHDVKMRHTEIQRYADAGHVSVTVHLDRDGTGAREVTLRDLSEDKLLAVLAIIA